MNSDPGTLQNIVTEPSLRALTAADYGRPKPRQRQSLQDAIRPHIDSFDYVVLEGMAQAAQV
uniref:Uncharacterized protein n=1 Tax=Eptatretus burgeri TaxID=7764 RepID=A0A8C4R9W8_EPTBU